MRLTGCDVGRKDRGRGSLRSFPMYHHVDSVVSQGKGRRRGSRRNGGQKVAAARGIM